MGRNMAAEFLIMFSLTYCVIGEEGVAHADGQRIPAVVVLPRALFHEHRVDRDHSAAILEFRKSHSFHPDFNKYTVFPSARCARFCYVFFWEWRTLLEQ